jgi:hypothetical protein
MKDFCTMGCNHCHLSADSKWEIEQIKKEAVEQFAKSFLFNYETYFYKEDLTYSPQFLKTEIIDKLLKEYTQCPTCKGKGSAYHDEVGIETCPDCRGKGEIR